MKRSLMAVVAVLCLGLVMTACGNAGTPVNPGSSSEGQSDVTVEPKEYDHEVISILTPKEEDVQIEIKVNEQKEADPRLDYTKVVVALIRQVENDIESVSCSTSIKEQMRANPKAIPESHEQHNYFVYSIGQVADSTEVCCNVGYYDNGNMVVELINFQNNDGLITIKDVDKLLSFLSGGVYVL